MANSARVFSQQSTARYWRKQRRRNMIAWTVRLIAIVTVLLLCTAIQQALRNA